MAIEVRPRTWAFAPGTEIGRGRTVVRLLGGGDRYEAWLGWDEQLLSTVVIKMLRPSAMEAEHDRRAIQREAALLGSLAHPAVGRLFDADLHGPRPYLVLEFLEGPRLSTLLRRFGPLSPEQVEPLATHVTSALGYLHKQGLVHLDIKPQNLIIGASPKLIDFSIARSVEEARSLRRPLGTDGYMAPEQSDADRLTEIGPWTDVWGLGATLFEAANGYRPFAASPRGTPPSPDSPDLAPFHARVQPGIAALIRRCLVPEPSARPTIADLLAALDDLSVGARDEAQRRLRRRVR